MLYLASQSPRRQSILQDLQVPYELLLPHPSEDAEALEARINDEPAKAYVARVTLAKLMAAKQRLVQRHLPFAPILCADTTVTIVLDTKELILGKPENAADASRMLNILSGKSHLVHTAVAILFDQKLIPEIVISTTEVKFASLSESTIENYVLTGEPMGKAGAYGIQGLGSCLIEKIHGSYSGVIGLPIYETCQLLKLASIPYILCP
jgi:septum formation protein